MEYIEQLKWRYATKKFDPNKKVSSQDLDKIKEAIQLAASAYGLQLYKVLIIEDKALREKLKAASFNQAQVSEASHFFVFCQYANLTEEHIDEYLSIKAAETGVPLESTKAYGDQMKARVVEQMPFEKQQSWMAKQVYITLSNALSACAILGIDATPMEGFQPEVYDEILAQWVF